jgi:hypothetical protein
VSREGDILLSHLLYVQNESIKNMRPTYYIRSQQCGALLHHDELRSYPRQQRFVDQGTGTISEPGYIVVEVYHT